MSERIPGPRFRASSFSGGGACVEVASHRERTVVRDSKHPDTVISVDRAGWAAFVRALREDSTGIG